jgi:hypothetical protein
MAIAAGLPVNIGYSQKPRVESEEQDYDSQYIKLHDLGIGPRPLPTHLDSAMSTAFQYRDRIGSTTLSRRVLEKNREFHEEAGEDDAGRWGRKREHD